MSGTTTLGIPYPQPADPVAEWPTLAQNQAERLDLLLGGHVQKGTVDVTVDGSPAASASVTFWDAFASAPFVLVTVRGTSRWIAATDNETTTGCDVIVRHVDQETNNLTVTVTWVAIGDPA